MLSNERISRFNIKVQDLKDQLKNGSLEPESIPVNRSHSGSFTVLKQIHLAKQESVKVFVTAVNSVGISAEESLAVSEKALGRYPR